MTGFHLGFPSHSVADVHMSDWGDLAAEAERMGFDAFWHSNERFFRDMFVRMTVSATRTTSITLGGAVADGYAANPALTAQTLATVNELADGRVTLAIGAGGSGLPMMGLTRSAVTDTTRAAYESIAGLLAGETVTRQTSAFTLRAANLKIFPAQHVPLWIASRGRRMLEMAGGAADGVMIASQARPAGLARSLSHVTRGAAAHGRDKAVLRTMARVDTCVHTDAERAREGCRLMVAKLLWMSFPDRRFVADAGLSVPEELEEIIATRNYDALETVADLVPDSMIDTFCWAGTPDQLVDRVAAVLDAVEVTDIGFWLLRAPGQSLREALALLAETLTDLRGRFGGPETTQ
ncbi:Phthiodiolone/phenolphthiodiolone dimycocerosates ketoreductase [Mycolicibacterium vanbaalenii]|uniref:Phthiodiolone/phenolphthiodiolone dimycocerosates ketoreductase n=1 Tax=Mycolicibacterium vanbaalenii TaxID=110539 RepID=A0A5S9R8W6_MYCVN|nr:LLM class flavin-dependent oxidoreductase [Mycolicibacterium vanbaalenii]CAA0132975.1 Phthiodiolone/phenolphthiodiolone dimycocerosates ketoreductase [Mycolicibacterium vanbaalenii]